MLPWLQVLTCCACEALKWSKSKIKWRVTSKNHHSTRQSKQSNAALLAIFNHACTSRRIARSQAEGIKLLLLIVREPVDLLAINEGARSCSLIRRRQAVSHVYWAAAACDCAFAAACGKVLSQ
jgi:hypothetical protein